MNPSAQSLQTEALAYEINGQQVSPEAFYALACDPSRSLALEACAGAGKTWVLIERMVRALEQGTPAAEMLAITFTKKAAGEMRQRLNERLREGKPELLRRVLEQGRGVQIRTFHSWFARLLRLAPMHWLQTQGLPLNFELIEDEDRIIDLLWPRFYAALNEAYKTEINTSISPDSKTQALHQALEDFKCSLQEHGRTNTLKALGNALKQRLALQRAEMQGDLENAVPEVCQVFEELPQGLGNALTQNRIREPLLACAAVWGRGTAAKQKLANELEQAISQQSLADVLKALLTKDFEPKKRMGDEPEIMAAQALALRLRGAQLQSQAREHHLRMVRLSRLALQEYAALKRERAWVDMGDVEAAAGALLGDPVLGAWIQQGLDAKVSQLLIDEFQDTNPMQWQALHTWLDAYAGAGGGEAPVVFIVGDPKQSIYRFRRAEPQVFTAAQTFIRHGLGGHLLSCDHTRRCAVAVVQAVNEVMLASQNEGEYTGYRKHSAQAALDTSRAMGLVGKLRLIAYEKEASKLNISTDATELNLQWRDSLTTPKQTPEERRRDLEAQQAARWVAAELRQGRLPQDFMVLARKRDALRHMATALQSAGIPYAFTEKETLIAKPEVQDVVALLDALISPNHHLSLAQALKSPLFNLDDDALVELANLADAQAADQQVVWLDLLAQTSFKTPKGESLHQCLVLYQSWLSSLPPHDALASIYQHADLPARFAAFSSHSQRAACLNHLQALLAAALYWQGGRYSTAYAFVRALKRGDIMAPDQPTPQAVQLLTIHGAKGLQAHTVLLLDCMSPPSKAETMGIWVRWPGELPAPKNVVFLPSEKSPPPSAIELLLHEQAASQREELNALYVAMTRAQERLIISALEPGRSISTRTWWDRIEPLAQAIEIAEPESVSNFQESAETHSPAADPESTGSSSENCFYLPTLPSVWELKNDVPAKPTADKNDVPAKLSADPVLKAQDREDSLTLDSADASARIGQAMHRLLQWCEWLDETTGSLPSIWSVAALQRVQDQFELSAEELQLALQSAQRIVRGEAAWAWQRQHIDWQANEINLSFAGQSLRIDRLVRHRETGEWWVLDFKSSHTPQSSEILVAQMRQYRDAVQLALKAELIPNRTSGGNNSKAASTQLVRAAWLSASGRLLQLED
jgi:ATP-dependent helicase/nuclease subunit A